MVDAPQMVMDFDLVQPGHPAYEDLALDYLEEMLCRHHRGRKNAVKIQEIADHFRWDRRVAHDLVARLVLERRLPVGTTSRSPAGVFWVVDEEDRRMQRHLYTRAMAMLRRYRIICRVSAEEIAGQVRIELSSSEPREDD